MFRRVALAPCETFEGFGPDLHRSLSIQFLQELRHGAGPVIDLSNVLALILQRRQHSPEVSKNDIDWLIWLDRFPLADQISCVSLHRGCCRDWPVQHIVELCHTIRYD